MFSIHQQLIKALRKLQNNVNGVDIAKSLQHVTAAAVTMPIQSVQAEIQIAGGMNATPLTVMSSLSKEQQHNEQQFDESEILLKQLIFTELQQKEQQENGEEQQVTNSSQKQCQVDNQSRQSTNFSIVSYLNEVGLCLTCGGCAQDIYVDLLDINSTEIIKRIGIAKDKETSLVRVAITAAAGTASTPKALLTNEAKAISYLRRSYRIQNFHHHSHHHQQQQQQQEQHQQLQQQRLQHFHTKLNQNLYAKQKQIHLAMSSLAAEAIALKQDDKIIVTNCDNCCMPDAINSAKQTNMTGATTATSSLSPSTSVQASSVSSSTSGKPCFNAGLGEILQFMELIGNLKHTKRTGWVLRDVNDCESISGHMYRMSMLTFLLDGTEGLNQTRCMELALVHDLAESLVGDITPFCGVSKDEKREMEFKAMADICKLIEPRGKRIMELFEEYEKGESAESKFVKDLDRLDMVMQAFEYEKRDNCLLKHQEFFDSTEGKFNHPFVKKLVNEIYEQRKYLAKMKGATPPPDIDASNIAGPTTNGHCVAAVSSLEKQQQQQHQQTSSNTTSS